MNHCVYSPSFIILRKIKSAPTEVSAQKMQTPIVAKLTVIVRKLRLITVWNLHFYQILPLLDVCKNGHNMPRQKKVLTSDSVSLALTVYHTQAKKTIEKGNIFIFPKYEKRPLLRDLFAAFLRRDAGEAYVPPLAVRGCGRSFGARKTPIPRICKKFS